MGPDVAGNTGMAEHAKLHIGCGSMIFSGWVNIDIKKRPCVDRVLDVTAGLPFNDVDLVFAEHFIEHLDFDAGLAFLRECRRVMRDEGVLRMSTPNLDWVWRTHYHPDEWSHASEEVRDCFWMNKAFRAWGHRFLYNLTTLEETLYEAGFADIVACHYGESRHEELQGLEAHETYPDLPGVPHIIVVEASGRRPKGSKLLSGPVDGYRQVMTLS
jgi:predicted SAM-dependent methyltransferase